MTVSLKADVDLLDSSCGVVFREPPQFVQKSALDFAVFPQLLQIFSINGQPDSYNKIKREKSFHLIFSFIEKWEKYYYR
jgi:hypothetical protein